MTGKFISFEGPEGAGKTTVVNALRETGILRDAVFLREPGGTRVGEAIRGILQHDTAGESPHSSAEPFLFCAARAQLTATVVRPALESGRHVVMDRYYDSTVVYQGYARGLAEPEFLEKVSLMATGGLEPDVTILLDIPPEHGLKRIASRSLDRFEKEAFEFHRRVREGYLAWAAKRPNRIVVVDALSEQKVVFEQVLGVVFRVLGLPVL